MPGAEADWRSMIREASCGTRLSSTFWLEALRVSIKWEALGYCSDGSKP